MRYYNYVQRFRFCPSDGSGWSAPVLWVGGVCQCCICSSYLRQQRIQKRFKASYKSSIYNSVLKCIKCLKMAKLKSTTLFYYVRQIAEMRPDISRANYNQTQKLRRAILSLYIILFWTYPSIIQLHPLNAILLSFKTNLIGYFFNFS